jgi:two-component system, OmpR family, response regulator
MYLRFLVFSMRILIVDDDRLLTDYLRLALKEDGHAVDIAYTGEEGGMLAMVHDYDALILDYVLPGASGTDVLRQIRNQGSTTPVLMLTARDAKEDVVEGLDAGADDYLAKPFEIRELRARLRALARRGGATRTENVRHGDLMLDRLTRRIFTGSTQLFLTPKEYSLLEYLLLHAGQVVTRSELLEKVWDLHFDPASNVVDVHVTRLRQKLQQSSSNVSVVTVRGSGFMLAETA